MSLTEKPFHWPGRRTNDPAHDMLVAFLVMDIQHNPEWARELSDRIAEVRSGKLPMWERLGNAYRLELTGKGALIEDLVDEDSPIHEVALEDLNKAVEVWMQAFE